VLYADSFHGLKSFVSRMDSPAVRMLPAECRGPSLRSGWQRAWM